jgi:hypothetical protein
MKDVMTHEGHCVETKGFEAKAFTTHELWELRNRALIFYQIFEDTPCDQQAWLMIATAADYLMTISAWRDSEHEVIVLKKKLDTLNKPCPFKDADCNTVKLKETK